MSEEVVKSESEDNIKITPFYRNLIFIFLLFLIQVSIFYPMISSSLLASTNDAEFHAYNLWYLKESIVNYKEIPAWTSDFFGGKPFLGLYQPGAYFWHLPTALLFPDTTELNFAIFFSSIIIIIGFYFLALKIFKSSNKALLSAILLSFLPYMLIAVKNPFTQLTSMIFVPYVFLLYEKYKEKQKIRYLALIGLLQGMTLLTHYAVGGVLLGSLIIFMLYDFFIEKKKSILKLIPFLIAGVVLSLVFLIPAMQIGDTLNFALELASKEGAHYAEKMRPIYYKDLLLDGSRIEYIGILGASLFIIGIASLVTRKKKDIINKYLILSAILLVTGLHLTFIFPDFVKTTFQWASRFYGVLAFLLVIAMFTGMEKISDLIIKYNERFKFIELKGKLKDNLKYIMILIFILLLIFDYSDTRITEKERLNIPQPLIKWYQERSQDQEFYRIEDQSVSPFGFTPILHNHGILNGAPSQEAPKYHFFFWSSAWQLLQSQTGANNFAGLYGSLSIKYFVSKQPIEIPGFELIEQSGFDYYIYKNKKFQPYARTVSDVVPIPGEDPNSMIIALNVLFNNTFEFSKAMMVNTNDPIGTYDLGSVSEPTAEFELLEKKLGYVKVSITNLEKPEYLVITESWHPNWKATQNGNNLKIYKGIPGTLVVPIFEEGNIELKYNPTSLKIRLFWVSLSLGIILIIIALLDLFGLKFRFKKDFESEHEKLEP